MSEYPIMKLPDRATLEHRRSVYGSGALDELEDGMRRRNVIYMIKALRTITGFGLKEAKDFICYFYPYGGLNDQPLALKHNLRGVYEVYARNLWSPEELQNKDVQQFEKEYAASKGPVKMTSVEAEAVKAPILLGIQSAVDHWQTMGFDSLYDACFMVLNNLEGKNRPKPPPPPTEFLG